MRFIYQEKKGVTLFELVLGLAVMGFVFTGLANFSNQIKMDMKLDKQKKIADEYEFVKEYILEEIKLADELIKTSSVEGLNSSYKNNMGYLIGIYDSDNAEDSYKYILYYIYNRALYRTIFKSKQPNYISVSHFEGKNTIIVNIDRIDLKIDEDLELILESDVLRTVSKHRINCKISK